MSCSPCSWSVC